MSTYASLHYHVVFSTKYRKPWLLNDWRNDLFDYMGGTIRGLDGFPQGIGGIEDHVHLLIGLKQTHRIPEVVRELKKASNTWIQDCKALADFAWQEGYAIFSVNATARDLVKRYIANQRAHHMGQSYLNELKGMLDLAEIEYDPKYLD